MRLLQKVTYAYLLSSILIGKMLCRILIILAPLLRKKPTKDFLFLPYNHKDNIGCQVRVQAYLPLLLAGGYSFDVHYISDTKHFDWVFHQAKQTLIREYLFYNKIFWSRILWCYRSSRYKTVFFQRGLFPEFYDQTGTPLEKLLRAYNKNIIVDYFDADYVRNVKLILSIVKECDTVAVVNDFLKEFFLKHHKHVVINDLSIDTHLYKIKRDFSIHSPARLFWTGNPDNLQHIRDLLPILREVNEKHPIKLILITRAIDDIQDSFVEHHLWSSDSFNDIIINCDIALYPAPTQDDISMGKVAYKCLEYACCKLPIIASPYGLTSRFTKDDVLIAKTKEEWRQNIEELIKNQPLREILAQNAYQKVIQYHDTEATYKNFLNILTEGRKG